MLKNLLVLVTTVICLAVMVCSVPSGLGVPASECKNMMDLVLVVDGSDSISAEDYVKQRIALTSLVKELSLGPQQTQVGIVVYSSTIAQIINVTYNLEDLVKGTTNLLHPRDGTETSLGIATAKQLFRDAGRANVPWVCIVITDGLSKDPALTAEEAAGARDMGVNMFAVGISHFIQQSELEAIASSPQQVLMLKTFDQLRTSLLSLMKIVCPCPPPPAVPYGIYDDGPRSIGSSRTVTCDAGYQAMGDPTITCLPDSKWSALQISCVACPPPLLEFGNGLIADGPITIDTVREYTCKAGYSSPEPILTTCMAGPEGPGWTVPKLMCLGCPPIVPLANGYFEPPVKDIVIGTVIQYHCNPGFIPTGPIESACIATNRIPTWTTPMHTCIACGPPPSVPFATVDEHGNTLVNSVRVYTCHPGYHPTGPVEAICMGEKGATYWHLTEHACRACDVPPKVPNAVVQKEGDTLVGSVRRYNCLKGFQETGPIEVICIANNGLTFWDGPEHLCVACVAPPVLPNAIVDPVGDTLIGSIRTYKCMDGYVPSGPIEVGCIKGTGGPLWTAPEFQCITCVAPSVLPNAVLDPKGDNFVGSQRLYNCIDGYVPSKPGPIMIECIGEYVDKIGKAFWSMPSHECRACPLPPPTIEFADVEPGTNLVGTIRKYNCHKGFFATGPISIECLPSAEWSRPMHSCTACGPLPVLPNADILPGDHTIGTVRHYKCHAGFVPDHPPEVTCMEVAKWSPVGFQCIGCNEPYPIKHAVLEPGDKLVGIIRRYTCLPGYYETGPITSTCAVPPKTSIPDWSTPVHFCKDCGEPYKVLFADAEPGPRTIGAIQRYVCHEGYVPTGPPNSHCMQNAEWTPPDFKCIIPKKPEKEIVYIPVPVPVPVPAKSHYQEHLIDHRFLIPFNPRGLPMKKTPKKPYYGRFDLKQQFPQMMFEQQYDWTEPSFEQHDWKKQSFGTFPSKWMEETKTLPKPKMKNSFSYYQIPKLGMHPYDNEENAALAWIPALKELPTMLQATRGRFLKVAEDSVVLGNFEYYSRISGLRLMASKGHEKLGECFDLIGSMYKVKFDTKDYCAKPILTDNTLNGNLLYGKADEN